MVVYLVLVALAVGLTGFALGYLLAPRQDLALLARVDQQDEFVEHLREVAWQNRDVSPELSTIVLDEIARHRQRNRPLDS